MFININTNILCKYIDFFFTCNDMSIDIMHATNCSYDEKIMSGSDAISFFFKYKLSAYRLMAEEREV